MKKLISGLLLFVMMVSLSGCGSTASAKGTVEQYFAAAKKLDTETMKKLIVPSNTDDADMMDDMNDAEEDASAKFFLDYLKTNAGKMTYKVLDETIDEDQAVVKVESRYVDGAPLIQATFGEAMIKMLGEAFSGQEPTEEETTQMFEDIMKEQQEKIDETFKTVTMDIDLVHQDDQWYIREVNDDMSDVISSGFFSALEGFGDAFGD